MLHPASIRAGHLLWTRKGTCWAIWRLHGMSYGMRPLKEKRAVRDAHQALFRILTGESMLLSVVVAQDPAAVVSRMVEGSDLEQLPSFAEEAHARLDSLEDIALGDRLYFLCVPLPNPGISKITASARASVQNFKARLALPHHGVSQAEIAARTRQSERIEMMIPGTFSPQRVSSAHQLWLDHHLRTRGLDSTALSAEDAELVVPTRHIGDPILDEGGKSDAERPGKLNPFAHRYVKVGDEDLFAEGYGSYQSILALTGLPAGGLTWPGSELLGDIDAFVPGADWVMRMKTRSSTAAKRANVKAVRAINDQLDQRDSEAGTGHHDLDAAIEALTELDMVFSSDRNEVENQPTILIAVCSDSAQDVSERARSSAQMLRDLDFSVAHPAGYQADLWWAFVPGTPLNPKIAEFSQITTSRALSGLVPIAAAKIGDEKGPLVALNITSSLQSPVHLDLQGMPRERDMSACVGVTGELGSGKSTTMKILAKSVCDLGGTIFATDRSKIGEWVKYIATLTDPTVVDMNQPAHSLDPLRMFDPETGATIAANFLITLMDVDPTTPKGVCLADVLDPAYIAEHQIIGLGGVQQHLAQRGAEGDEVARELAGAMGVFSRQSFARAIFDASIPPLPWKRSRAMVVRTNNLEMPEEAEIMHEHLYRKMRLEKHYGRAAYTLITALAREICFADASTFAAYLEDEAHMATRNPLSVADLTLFIRDGRKHGACLILGSHDPMADFGDETMRSLIPIRIVHRQTDRHLAKRSLEWLGTDAEDEDLVDELMSDTAPQIGGSIPVERRGEGYMKDATGNIGRVKMLIPAAESSRKAASTTPTRSTVTDGAP